MKREIVHMIVKCKPFKVKIGRDAKTRCGKIACVVSGNAGLTRYDMLDAHGNRFVGTGRDSVVTCKKCINLITTGTINGIRMSGSELRLHAGQRSVSPPHAVASRSSVSAIRRAVGRPSGRARD